MSSRIRSSHQSQPSKVKIINVPATLKASVTAKNPKDFVLIKKESGKELGQTDSKNQVKPIKVPGCPLPRVIPGHIEPIESKGIQQKKKNFKENKPISETELIKKKKVTQEKVTKDGILKLKGIIKDYQKEYKFKTYSPSNYCNRKSEQDNIQREIYEYPHRSNSFPLENLLTPREYSLSPSFSSEFDDITSLNTFDEPITLTGTFQKPIRDGENSSGLCKRIILDISDSDSELISRENFNHNVSDKENILHDNNIMLNKMQGEKDCSKSSGNVATLSLSQPKKRTSQSSVKKVVTFSDPPEMPNILDEANTDIVPVKQGYLRVRERPHDSILGNKDRNKKISSHTYKKILNPNPRLTQKRPSGMVCNRAVKLGLFESKQGIVKSKASSQRNNSSHKKSVEEKKNKALQKDIETRNLSNNTSKSVTKSESLSFVNENMKYLLNLKKASSSIDGREPSEVEARELEKAIFLASEIRGKLQEHSAETLSDLTTLISDLRTGRFDEDKYIISKRVDKCIRKTYEKAINEVRDGRISSPVPTWSENRRAIWKDEHFENLSPRPTVSTQKSKSISQYPSSVKLKDTAPPLFYSPKRSKKIKMNRQYPNDKKESYSFSNRGSKKEKSTMKDILDMPSTSKSELKHPKEYTEENKGNKKFGDTYTLRPTSLQRSSQVKLNIPANRVIQTLPGVSISPKNNTESLVANRNKIFEIKHHDTFSETSELEERDQNKNHCSQDNIEKIDFTNEPKPKSLARKTPNLQDNFQEDKKSEKSAITVNDEQEEDKLDFYLSDEKVKINNSKKKSHLVPENNVEENELPGYFPEVVWEEVEIPDQPPVEGSSQEVEELEQKLQQHHLQQRLLNRLEDGLRQLLIRDIQINSPEEDISSPAESMNDNVRLMHDGHINQDQTMLAARSVLEKLVREHLTRRREQRQQRISDNPISIHGDDGVQDFDSVSMEAGSSAASYTTPESPSKISSHATLAHSLEEKVCSPSNPPSAVSLKSPGALANPILTPDPSLDIQDTIANSFTSISSPSPLSPSPSPPLTSLPKSSATSVPDAPEQSPHLITNKSLTQNSRSHSASVPSVHQSHPNSPYVTPFQSPHITAHSSPSHQSQKLSASDLRSSSGASHSHTEEESVQTHNKVNVSPSTTWIQPNSGIIQDLIPRQLPIPESQLRDMITTLLIDSQEKDIPQPPPPTPASEDRGMPTIPPMDLKVKDDTQISPTISIPQVPDISTTPHMDSRVLQTPPPTPISQNVEITPALPMDLREDQIYQKEGSDVFVYDEEKNIESQRRTLAEDVDQVSRVSDSSETWSPLTPAVACYSSGNATVSSTEASNKTWVTMSEGEILPGLVNTSLFEEGEIMFHKDQKQRFDQRSISLQHKKGINRSISCEGIVVLESISEGALLVEDLTEDTVAEESLIDEALVAAGSISSKGLSLEDLLEDSFAEDSIANGLSTNKTPSEGADMNSFCISEGMLISEDQSGKGNCSDESRMNPASSDAEGCTSVVQDSTYSQGEAKDCQQLLNTQWENAESSLKSHKENPELTQLQQENAALLARFEHFRKFAFLSKSASVGSARSRISK